MATSFRFTPEEEERLQRLASKYGTSKAKVIRIALQKLHDETEKEEGKQFESMLDRLISGGFKPMTLNLGDLAHNEEKQRQYIREILTKRNQRNRP